MSQYLLSVHSTADEAPAEPPSPEDMAEFMGRVDALEAEMAVDGAFVFGGRLHGPDAATVVRMSGGDVLMTDGPYIESKEHIGGFYIIEADDLDAALAWAGKVVDAIGAPIEVRPFVDSRRA
jgi:hypothetical protein